MPSASPSFLRFTLSGAIGTAAFFLLHESLLVHLPPDTPRRTTAAWALSYALSIWWQHALHRLIVYGSDAPYWSSLLGTYVSYAASFIISTLLNDALVNYAGVPVRAAWGATMASTGVLSYVLVSKAFATTKEKGETKRP